MKNSILLFIITSCFLCKTNAANFTWTGNLNTNWYDSSNWLGGTSPGRNYPIFSDSVIIGNVSRLPTYVNIGAPSNYSNNCRGISVTNLSNGSLTLNLQTYANNISITNCYLNRLYFLIQCNNATINIKLYGTVVNTIDWSSWDPTGGTSSNATINTEINFCKFNSGGIQNSFSNASVYSKIYIDQNSDVTAVLNNGGPNSYISFVNSTYSSKTATYSTGASPIYNGDPSRPLYTSNKIYFSNSILNNAIINNRKSTTSEFTISNCTLNYDSSYTFVFTCLNFEDSSGINWINSNINFSQNITMPGGGAIYLGNIGRGNKIEANITCNYTNNNIFLLFAENATNKYYNGLKYVNAPIIKGNIKLYGGGIGFNPSAKGAAVQIDGDIIHYGTNLNGSNALKLFSQPGGFRYGGYYLLNSSGNTNSPQGRNTIVLMGSTDTKIIWPTNFYADQLVINKSANGLKGSVTLDSTLVIGSNLHVIGGELIINASHNPFGLIVADTLLIKDGCSVYLRNSISFPFNRPDLYFHRDFSSYNTSLFTPSVRSYFKDENFYNSRYNGLYLDIGVDISNSRNIEFNWNNGSLNRLNFAKSKPNQTVHLSNHLYLDSLNITNGTSFSLNNFNLKLNSQISGYSDSNFIRLNGLGRLFLPVGVTPVVFPVGINAGKANYTPVTLSNTGIVDTFGVGLISSVRSAGLIGKIETKNWINKTWNITEGIQGGSNLTATFQWPISDTLSGFNANYNYVSNYQNNGWDILEPSAPQILGSYRTQTRTNIHTLSAFGISSSATPNICAGNNFILPASSSGTSYQWQVNSGSGFVNIADGINYNGANAQNLSLVALPTSYYGYQYRCLVNNIPGIEYDVKFNVTWYGNNNTAWLNSGNWGCVTTPDAYTDVVIPAGASNFPAIIANTTVRTLIILAGASVNVASGVNVTVNK
jgi:hypothetical protein